jgi:DNA-binding NtrC family response regulator
MGAHSAASGKPNILVVDDELSMLMYARMLLESSNYSVETAGSGEEALQKIKKHPPDLMLVDMQMPAMDGLQTIRACRNLIPDQRIVVVSCTTDTSNVVQAIRLGALDYMTKPIYKAELDAVVTRCLSSDLPENGIPGLHFTAKDQEHIDELHDDLFFLAASPAMKQIRAQSSIIANVNVPVLFLGESGVGKEILARLIHQLSPRSQKPFLKVNCAALPTDLLESELFGYEAGAFTGASRMRIGKFELANHGTILLDELGEMSPVLQAKLLHVLQDGQFYRLGGSTSTTVDVRVLAATNIDIGKAISQKTFREDLYYRLNAFTMNIPPLRERREEIPVLMKHFMSRFSRYYSCAPLPYSQELMAACCRYSWPGNLRELGNFVKRYLVLRDEMLSISELEEKNAFADQALNISQGKVAKPGLKFLVRSSRDEIELKAIQEALTASNWNRRLAASRLHISYKALRNKIKDYGITRLY